MHQTYGWEKYLLFENAFLKAKEYADIRDENFGVISLFFSNQIILLGSEIEAAFKKICELNGVSGGNMLQYKEETLKSFPSIAKYTNDISFTDYQIKPFDDWKEENAKLDWWEIYTNVKHFGVDEKATMKTALCMLSALQILLLLIEAKSASIPDHDGYRSAVLFQNEIPTLLVPPFKRKASLTNIGLMATYFIPSEEII